MKIVISLAVAFFLLPSLVLAGEWYEDVTFVDNDPFQFDSQRAVLFPHSGLTLVGHPATGNVYAVLPDSTIAKLETDPRHLIVVDTHKLTVQEAATYKTIFHAVSSSSQIPWVVGAIGSSIPSSVTAAVGIMSTLLDGLSRYAQANQKISSEALEQLMAANGQFELVLLLTHDPQEPTHQYLSSTVVYTIDVGAERRTYAICSSTFALKRG